MNHGRIPGAASLLLFIPFLLWNVAITVADEPTVQLRDFRSEEAKQAVRTYNDRITFLEQSLQQHVESAQDKLQEDLKASLEAAAKQGDLKETERISKFLQNGMETDEEENAAANRAKIRRLEKEVASLKERLEAVTAPDPLTGKWRYQSGNICEFTTDGWVVLKGKRIAAWKRVSDQHYVSVFLKNFADGSSDELFLNPDGNTITGTSKTGKSFSVYRVEGK